MKNFELLAPAGDWEAFKAGIENGADAIYFGGKNFSARQFANNFDFETMKKACDYAHLRGAKIFVTMNTLILDEEIEDALKFAEEVCEAGADAIIVQDLGFAKILKQVAPEVELHASTQMTIYDINGVKTLENLGFSRVVLARELSNDKITEIVKESKVEIEVFIHGALCICYSGQCLMSSIIGARSGNRGKCAQPCRLPYKLLRGNNNNNLEEIKEAYLLSPKDLITVEFLDNILKTGIKSLKIEGRMKSPEYVAQVVSTYRKYIDNNESKLHLREDVKKLKQVFNRGGNSSGYLKGNLGVELMSFEKPGNMGITLGEVISYNRNLKSFNIKLQESINLGDVIEIWNGNEMPSLTISSIKVSGVSKNSANISEIAEIGFISDEIIKGSRVYKTFDLELIKGIRESYKDKFSKKLKLECSIEINNNKNPIVKVIYENRINIEYIENYIPQIAINKCLTREKIIEQFEKTGGTSFVFEKIDVSIDEGIIVPISLLNNMRRKALEKIEIEIINSKSRKVNFNNNDIFKKTKSSRTFNLEKSLTVLFNKFDKVIKFEKNKIKRVYVPITFDIKLYQEIEKEYINNNIEVFFHLPNITWGKIENLIKEQVKYLKNKGHNKFMISNIGSFEYFKDFIGVVLVADHGFNIFNSQSVKSLKDLNISGINLSHELNLKQIRNMHLIEGMEYEATIFGRLPLMTSEYCPVGSIIGGKTLNNKCEVNCINENYYLEDRIKKIFPILCDNKSCRTTIFNADRMILTDYANELIKTPINSFRLEFINENIEEVNQIINIHYEIFIAQKKINICDLKLIERLKNEGFTKGHFYRGV